MPGDAEKRKWDQLHDHYDGMLKQFHKDGSEGSASDGTEDGAGAGKGIKGDGNQPITADQRQRRKEQNRAAQRAFRERKERYVKELEEKIKSLQEAHTQDSQRLLKENEELKATIKQMESEMYTLRGAAMAFEVTMNRLREAGIELPSSVREMTPPVSDKLSQDGKISPVQLPAKMEGEVAIERIQEHEVFAESIQERFDHSPDPITLTGAKLIPCSEVWDHLSEHPDFDRLDLDALCEEVKKKAKCSGSGPVIEEEELHRVVRKMIEGA